MEFTDDFDYYKVLEVEPDANLDDIKKQYRKLALQFHPDKCRDASQKQVYEETFKRISKAYSVLGDKTERRRYDRVRRTGNIHNLEEEWSEFSFEDALRTFAEFVYTFNSNEAEVIHDGVIEIPFETALMGGSVRAQGRRITVGGILDGSWQPVVEIGQEVYVLRVKFPATMPREQVNELERLLVYAQGATFALKNLLPNLQTYIVGARSSNSSRALFWGASAAVIFSGLALAGMLSNNRR